jgi:curved DNA-binding protein CbpA
MKWKNLHKNYNSYIDKLRKMTAYEILEVSSNITEKELKEAYLKKIKLYHPDTTDEFMKKYNEEVSKLINNAFQKILKEIK